MTVPALEWREAARADLLTIVDYISDDNPDAAQRLKDEIEEKISKLPARPKLYRPGRIAGTREMVVRPNYIVVYAETTDAIAHPARPARCSTMAVIAAYEAALDGQHLTAH